MRKSRLVVGVHGVITALALGVVGIDHAGIFDEEPTVVESFVFGGFEDIAELAVEEYTFNDVGEHIGDRKMVLGVEIPGTGNNFLVSYSGTIKAGIADASKIEADVNDQSQTITIKAPKVEILEAHIDENSIVSHDQSYNPFNQVQVEQVSGLIASETDAAVTDAKAGGLLDKAESSAEELLTNFVQDSIRGTEVENYAIEFKWK